MSFSRFHVSIPTYIGILTLSMLGLPAAASAVTIGNVASWSQAGQDVTFDISDGSKLRVTVLADDLIRFRFAPNGTFTTNVSQAVAQPSWPVTGYTATDNGADVTVSTVELNIVVQKAPCVVACRDGSNDLIVTDDPVRRIEWASGSTRVHKTTQTGESYLGLGWRTLGLKRNGSRFVMNNVPSYGSTETFYGGIPLWHGHRNGEVYAIFFDDTSWGEINVGQASSSSMSFANLGGQVDYYFFWGPSMAKVLDRYTELTGRPYMPPRWSVGYQQCRWSYHPQSQVLSIANEFRNRSIPCDVIYLDIDYMPGGHQLTFDPAKFPSPSAMITTLHNQGFKVVANVSPFLFTSDPKYGTAAANSYFIKTAGGSIHHGWHDYWFFVGGASTGSLAFLDFSKTAGRNWWAGQHTSFLNNGIDGIWNDLNEPDELGGAWASNLKYDFDGNPVDHSKTSTQYCLLQTQLSYDILQTHYPTRRPFVLSRGAYAGIQRWSSVWSGDNTGAWGNDYQRNIPMGLSMSISGQPHNGHDIGGFFGSPTMDDAPPPELYARWMQSGVFNPFCRQHHDGFGNYANPPRPFVEPWQFGTQVETICRDFIGLRYRLMPYLYTLFHEAHAKGAPIQRPTVYDFPADINTLTQDHDFMFGPWLLVAPVTSAGATTWNTYLPAGAQWIHWWDDVLYAGGQSHTTAAPLEQLPIFVRGGAIIPMAPVSQYEGDTAVDVLTLELYPINEASSFTLYEDDGLSWDYQGNTFAKTAYAMTGVGNSFTLVIGARQGTFVPAARSYLLKAHRWPGHTNTATLNDAPLTEHLTWPAFDAAGQGYFLDTATNVLYAKFNDTGGDLTFTFGGPQIPDVPGDMDFDGDVDQEDFGVFQYCFSGPGLPVTGPCEEADLDFDTDVDGDDTAIFLLCKTAPNVLGDPACDD